RAGRARVRLGGFEGVIYLTLVRGRPRRVKAAAISGRHWSLLRVPLVGPRDTLIGKQPAEAVRSWPAGSVSRRSELFLGAPVCGSGSFAGAPSFGMTSPATMVPWTSN